MEQNFQTSFIPKKPMVEKRASSSRPMGFFTVISVFILFTILLASAGLYFYEGVTEKSKTRMENDLSRARNRFEPSLIEEIRLLDRRLNAANEILSNHIAITPVFEALQLITMKTVRYTDFDYTLGDTLGDKINVKLTGVALGYRSIALQSDLFAKEKNLIDPVFSNLTLNEQGNVLFDLEFLVESSFVNYQQTLLAGDN